MFDKVINLIYTGDSEETDADGYPIIGEIKTEVFAQKLSVTRTEFYSAMQSGMRPSIVFKVWNDDYELTKHTQNGKSVYADKVEYDGSKYDIIRTYSKDETYLELVCG